MSKTEVISVNEKPESKMVNIVSRQTKNGNIVISLEDSQYFYLPFDKNAVDLSDNKTREQFIKAIEKQVRTSKLYKAYVSYLKVECGMEHCAVFGNVTSTIKSKTKVEMHHGPILTLFDYCAIVTDAFLKRGELLTTFRVARTVLDEHFLNHVQTIMLSKTVHQLVDTGEIFINFNQCNGNLNEFLKKFADGLNEERIQKINRYIDLCEQYDSYDNRLLDIKNTITNWDYEEAKKRARKN